MEGKPILEVMRNLFQEILSKVESDPRVHYYAVQSEEYKRLIEGLQKKEKPVVSWEETTQYSLIMWKYGFPKVATLLSHQLKNQIAKAYDLWVKFREVLDSRLKEFKCNWDDFEEAYQILKENCDKLESVDLSMLSKEELKEQLKSIMETLATPTMISNYVLELGYLFDLYSLPLTLGIIAPYVDPENALKYLEEGWKAFLAVAIGHLRKELTWIFTGTESVSSLKDLMKRIEAMKEAIEAVREDFSNYAETGKH